jgi:prepilin-type N-terminal cleavage/methylation domain-containing protein
MKIKIKNNGLTGEITSYLTGLTLIEMLMAIAMIAILTSIVLMVTERSYSYAEQKATEGTISLLDSALQEYRDFYNDFPDPNGIKVVSQNEIRHSVSLYDRLNFLPDSRRVLERIPEGFIRKVEISGDSFFEFIDSWGTTMDYRYVGGMNFPLIISAGRDKNFATEADNITNKR